MQSQEVQQGLKTLKTFYVANGDYAHVSWDPFAHGVKTVMRDLREASKKSTGVYYKSTLYNRIVKDIYKNTQTSSGVSPNTLPECLTAFPILRATVERVIAFAVSAKRRARTSERVADIDKFTNSLSAKLEALKWLNAQYDQTHILISNHIRELQTGRRGDSGYNRDHRFEINITVHKRLKPLLELRDRHFYRPDESAATDLVNRYIELGYSVFSKERSRVFDPGDTESLDWSRYLAPADEILTELEVVQMFQRVD